MVELLAQAERSVVSSNSPFAFRTTGDANWPRWNRYLTVFGKRAYYLGNSCGTCAFFFKRLKNSRKAVDVSALTDRLAKGVTQIDDPLLDSLSQLLPPAVYRIGLLRVRPREVFPGSRDDYFATEQVENEANVYLDSKWGVPQYPRVTYYRPDADRDASVSTDGARFFEFIVPMVPGNKLDQARVGYFNDALSNSEPTAIALSVLDIKGPAEFGVKHWCLTHFLIDGHHKMAAAARSQRPLSLLAFVSVGIGVSSRKQIDHVFSTYV